MYPRGARDFPNTHLNGTAPWDPAASTMRPYSSTATTNYPANRLFEYMNTGP